MVVKLEDKIRDLAVICLASRDLSDMALDEIIALYEKTCDEIHDALKAGSGPTFSFD